MEEVEIALLVVISIIVVLLSTIWWAIRARKRQENSSRPIKVPSPQEDLREARSRYFSESKQTESKDSDAKDSDAGDAKREFSFTKLQRTWASKEQQERNRRPRNCDTILETDEKSSTPTQPCEIKSPISVEQRSEQYREFFNAETKKMGDEEDGRRTSRLITPLKQKVIRYKYSSLPNTKLPSEGFDDCGHPIIQPI